MPTTPRRTAPALAFLLGILFTVLGTVGGLYLYLRFGHPPVAVADHPFPDEGQIVHLPLSARIDRELATAPITAHARQPPRRRARLRRPSAPAATAPPATTAPSAKPCTPASPSSGSPTTATVVGVSDDETGETYWKVSQRHPPLRHALLHPSPLRDRDVAGLPPRQKRRPPPHPGPRRRPHPAVPNPDLTTPALAAKVSATPAPGVQHPCRP